MLLLTYIPVNNIMIYSINTIYLSYVNLYEKTLLIFSFFN